MLTNSELAVLDELIVFLKPFETVASGSSFLWSHHSSLIATVTALGADASDDSSVELHQYLDQLPCDLKSDPFKVWEPLKGVFPNAYAIALKYLTGTRQLCAL